MQTFGVKINQIKSNKWRSVEILRHKQTFHSLKCIKNTLIVLMMAKVKATPQKILPAASTAATWTIGPSE